MRAQLNKLLLEYETSSRSVVEEREALIIAENRQAATDEARQILQILSATIQQEAHTKIAKVVSRCLEAVFDEPYEFKIEFEAKRGRTEANLLFCRGEMTVDPMTAAGGGVIDVASFALRLSCLMLSRPRLRKILVLDEPFRFVSKEYRERVRELIMKLSEEMGVQFIIVTHINELRCGTVIEIE